MAYKFLAGTVCTFFGALSFNVFAAGNSDADYYEAMKRYAKAVKTNDFTELVKETYGEAAAKGDANAIEALKIFDKRTNLTTKEIDSDQKAKALTSLNSPESTKYADLQKGLDAYNSGNYDLAHAKLYYYASQGNADAQAKMGFMYARGLGTAKNYQKAMDWNLKAAKQGNKQAQSNLGVMFYHGQGVEIDYQQARLWFLKSAKKGHGLALYTLSYMHGKGLGVRKDNASGYMYSKLAVYFGLKKAQENSNERVNSRVRQAEESITKEAQQNLNVFIDKMSVYQIRQAEKMVNEWLRNFKIRNKLIGEASHNLLVEANAQTNIPDFFLKDSVFLGHLEQCKNDQPNITTLICIIRAYLSDTKKALTDVANADEQLGNLNSEFDKKIGGKKEMESRGEAHLRNTQKLKELAAIMKTSRDDFQRLNKLYEPEVTSLSKDKQKLIEYNQKPDFIRWIKLNKMQGEMKLRLEKYEEFNALTAESIKLVEKIQKQSKKATSLKGILDNLYSKALELNKYIQNCTDKELSKINLNILEKYQKADCR